jgi:two-component system, sensor histidine kinase
MTISFIQSFLGELCFNITEDNLRIRADQIRARLRLYPVMLSIQALLEPLFVSLFWDYADHQTLLLWLSCIYTLHSVDILLWWRNRQQLNTVNECRRWDKTFKILTLLTALTWGSFTLWFFPQDLALLALMICVVFGLVAGAVTLDSVYPPSLYIYIFGVTLPLLARLMHVRDETHWLLAGMLLMYLVGALSAGRELSKTFWKSLWQRYENDILIQQLTEQKAIAETANREKSRFLASASHDLRQPLQALVLFSEALQEVAKDNDTRHLAGQIGKSVGALVDMFDKLLDISKFDAGVVQAVMKHFKPQDVFDRLQADFTHLALAKDLQLAILNTNLVAYSDPHLLERILRNLIANAIRYTHTGNVTVSCKSVNDMLQFDVKDTGIGISAENIPHIFEEYYQVDNQHRDRLKGLGLGLAIVRRMESLLGCNIAVTSTPGQGSVFSFSVPQGNAAQLEQPVVPQHSKHNLSGITVALVEDNHDIRQMVAALLKQWGCLVYDGELPNQVLATMEAAGTHPDIFICDYRLPNELTAIDGIRLLRRLWPHEIPALVLTGDTAPQTLQEIQASGALLLHKPIAPARLRSIMYFALHKENSASFNTNT